MQAIISPTCSEEHMAMLTSADHHHLVHRRAAHFAHDTLRRTTNMTRGFDYHATHHPPFCDSCPAGNSKYPTLKTKRSRASQPMERIHCDLWGKTQSPSLNGNRYVICFVDDYSRHIALYFLKRKSDAPAALLKYIAEYATPLQINVRRIQSDGGGGFLGPFSAICREQGIRQDFSSPDVQAQNSVAERTWRTVVSATVRMLEDAQLPVAYWEDAMKTAAWVKNRVYSKAVDGTTPHGALWSEDPDLSLLKVWGSPCYVHIPPSKSVQLQTGKAVERKRKLDSKVRPAVFVGYPRNYKAWSCYDPQTKTYLTTRLATFNERVGITTPTLTLLKQPQPKDLQTSDLVADMKALDLRHLGDETITTPPTLPTERPATTADTLRRSSRHRTESKPHVAVEGRAMPDATQPALSEATANTGNTRWMQTPRERMTVKDIARHFNVDARSYHQWMATFAPFGPGERMQLSSFGRKKNATRFDIHTDVPIPIGDASFVASRAHTKQANWCEARRQGHSTTAESASALFAYALTVTTVYHTLVTPANFGKVKGSPQSDSWWEAMQTEYNSLIALGTWELVTRKPGDSVIGSQWCYKIKDNPDGTINKFKARLVARGDQQDASSYTDIFAPVIKFVTLRILLAIACVMNWDIQQVDVGNAYCNAYLTEDDILMRQPPGFEQYGSNGETLVCKLRKSLYGLRQAGRQWNTLLNSWLVDSKWKFTRCRADYCLYHTVYEGQTLIVGCYVDDLVITGSCTKTIAAFKADIATRFKISDLGELKWILGMEVTRDRKKRTLTLHQRKYIRDILELFGMSECNPRATPADPSVRLSKEDSPEGEKAQAKVDVSKYRTMVGKLVYLMVASEPGISFAVSQLSRFFSCPGPKHFDGCRWAISYLKGILPTQGLTFRGDKGFNLHAYCDSDWAGCPDTRRSTSGFAVMFAGASVSWIAKRQPTVALSSAEAEYVTACLAAQEVQWIRQLLAEISVPIGDAPTVVYSDSQSAIHMANNPTSGRAKHMDIKYHFVKEARERGVLTFKYVSTNEQAADILTKALARPKFVTFRDVLTGQSEQLHVQACQQSATAQQPLPQASTV